MRTGTAESLSIWQVGTRRLLAPSHYRKVLKGRPAMCTSPQPVVQHAARSTANIPQPSVCAERTYQGLTIAAMLWILGSLWLFR